MKEPTGMLYMGIFLFFYDGEINLLITFHLKWLQLDSNPEPLSSSTNSQPFGQTGWVFVYELSGSGFESSRSHLNFRFRSECQGVPWHPGNYRVLIHSETRTWNDKIIQPSIMFPSFLFLYFFGWYECTILWIS